MVCGICGSKQIREWHFCAAVQMEFFLLILCKSGVEQINSFRPGRINLIVAMTLSEIVGVNGAGNGHTYFMTEIGELTWA